MKPEAYQAKRKPKHGELPLTMLSVIHDRDMEPSNNDINVTNTLTDRREVDYRPSPLKAKKDDDLTRRALYETHYSSLWTGGAKRIPT